MRTRLLNKALGLGLAVLAAFCLAVPAAASASGEPVYRGFQVHSLWYERSNSEMQRELNMIQEIGGNSVRVDVAWSSLESEGKGEYTEWYLEKLDRFVQGASERGIKVIATVATTPCWASSAPESLKQGCAGSWWERGVQNYPPSHAGDFANAVRFIVSRYGSKLAALEVWNEPNTERFLVSPDRAGAYTALVKAAYPAAKAADPEVPVIVGALAMADRPFLDELYADGIKGFYDGISVHPYNEWRDPYDRWQPQWKEYTFLPGLEWIHEGQIAAGDNTPIWVTEFGWDTCVGGEWCVSEAQQAQYTVEAFRILNSLGYVYGATAYELRDESTDKSEFEGNWGLVHQDFSPKPAFAAVSEELHSPTREEAVTLEVEVAKGGTVVASGKTLEAQPVSIKISGCQQTKTLMWTTKPNRKGLYRRTLGSVKYLRGCAVTAKPRRSGRAAKSSVPGGGLEVTAARVAS